MSSDTAIIYFSKDGSTRVVANLLSQKHDADIIELVEQGKKSGFFKGASKASKKQGINLEGEPYNEISNYNRLYLCTPIWAFNGTPAMNTFIEKADFSEKEVIIVTVKGFAPDGAMGKTHKFLTESVEKKSGNVIKCVELFGAKIGKTASEESILEQIGELNI